MITGESVWDTGMYPYSLLFGARRNWFGNGESVPSGMLPHLVRAVGDVPTVFHPTGQSEAQVHTDVVVQSPVVCRCISAEQAIPVCHFTLNDLTVENESATLFHFPGGGWADYIIQTNVPVMSVV